MQHTRQITDPEFGTITIRRSRSARTIRIRVGTNRQLRASIPFLTPLFMLKKMIATSRQDIRKLVATTTPLTHYINGDAIGKSHTLILTPTTAKQPKLSRQGNQIVVELPSTYEESGEEIQQLIRTEVIKTLRREAKAYLPRRLAFLADKFSKEYQSVRFSHASSRWGSCSSNGTISLNIALMKLPFEQIDYVLVHELAHTVEMNHSAEFWSLVEAMEPNYTVHRSALKHQSPTI